jgi:hypothetical protein
MTTTPDRPTIAAFPGVADQLPDADLVSPGWMQPRERASYPGPKDRGRGDLPPLAQPASGQDR